MQNKTPNFTLPIKKIKKRKSKITSEMENIRQAIP